MTCFIYEGKSKLVDPSLFSSLVFKKMCLIILLGLDNFHWILKEKCHRQSEGIEDKLFLVPSGSSILPYSGTVVSPLCGRQRAKDQQQSGAD